MNILQQINHYGSIGGQIMTASSHYNSNNGKRDRPMTYPNTGCHATLTHNCFSCPVAECYYVIKDRYI